MKTPEEIKRGMEHCAEIGCKGCPYEEDCKMFDGFSIPAEDAYFYIQQMEQDNAQKDERIRQLEREKELLIEQLHGACHACKHQDKSTLKESCIYCIMGVHPNWEWRGVEEEA